jgi:glycerate 2-kinase
MRRDALEIIKQAIQAVDPYTAVKTHFRIKDNTLQIGEDQIKLQDYNQIVLVSFGKASAAMATAVLEQLQAAAGTTTQDIPRLLLSGLVICKDDHATSIEQETLESRGIPIRFASHPVPDSRSVEAAQELLEIVQDSASPQTLVVCCISGGGSALFCRPRAPLTLQDLQDTNTVLLGSGMGIQEMNVIRKRLEEGKGGRLAARSHPSTVVTLVLSDVLGDPLDLIASGPTVPDTSTWADAWRLVQQNKLEAALPSNVVEMLKEGFAGKLADSPPPSHPAFETASTVLVGNNELAVEAAAAKAQECGYQPVILGTQVEGEAKEVALMYTAMSLYLQQQQQQKQKSLYAIAATLPVALIAGGETTVSLSAGSGKGGRNQELALSAALQLESLGIRNVVLASVGTDGTDGPNDAAGAIVDGTTVTRSLSAAQEALSGHNAYVYFSENFDDEDGLSPLIKTGPTGTNVADVCVTLVQKDVQE